LTGQENGEAVAGQSGELSGEREWWTYADLAALLGITPDGVRIRAKRGGWDSRKANRPGEPDYVRPPLAVLSSARRPKRRAIAASPIAVQSAEQSAEIKRLSAELQAISERLSGVEAERSRAVEALAVATAALAAAEAGARAERERLLGEVERLSADNREARLPWLVRVVRALRGI
jgi:hypothetical protein